MSKVYPCDISINIKDLKQCPHCKGEFGYYQKVNSSGKWNDGTSWEGIKQNTEMMDGFTDTWTSKYYYCAECHKKICKV